MPTDYPHEDRDKMRATIRQIGDLAEETKRAAARGEPLPEQTRQVVAGLTRSEDPETQIKALGAMQEELRNRHLARLLPLAKGEFAAFCEYVNPEEPPESKWHRFLCDTLQQIELDPKFNRFILNVPPGHAKPLHVDTPVLMADGTYKRLGDIVVGDRVVSHTGRACEVTAVHEQGVLPLLKITTKAGRVVYAEQSHSFKVGSKWKAAGKLKIDDPLDIIAVPPEVGEATEDDDAFRFAALAQANGSYSVVKKLDARYVNYHFWTSQEVIARAAKDVCERMGIAHKIHAFGEKPSYAVRISQEAFTTLGDKFGLRVREEGKRVPEFVFRGTDEQIKIYLSTFFSSRLVFPKRLKHPAGMVYSRSIELLRDLQRLLSRLNLFSYFKVPPSLSCSRWALVVPMEALRAYFACGLSYVGSDAEWLSTALLRPVTGHRRTTGAEADSVASQNLAEPGECRCLTVADDHTFTADGIVVHNSTYASRLYVAWSLGRDPDKKIIGAGNSQRFVENEFSKKIRNLIQTPEYRRVFPEIVISHDTRAADQWALAGRKGQYVAKGAGQAIHGHRANFVCVDDPYGKIEDAESPTIREGVLTWFLNDIGSRLLPGAKVFVIMTRFHEEDLTGSLLELNKKLPKDSRYFHMEAPAICFDPSTDILRRNQGEVLWEYYNLQYFLEKRANSSYQRFSLIYQQLADASNPDNIASCIKFYDRAPHKTDAALSKAKANGQVDDLGRPKVNPRDYYRRLVVSVDCAAKKTERADYTVVQVWGEGYDHNHYLLDQARVKVEFPQMVQEIETKARKWEVDCILVEDKGQGTAYIQARGRSDSQRRLAPAEVIPISVPSNQGKEFRFDEITPLIETGNVHVPQNADWVDLFVREVGQFPDGAHDDQVDAMSQYLRWAKKQRSRYGSRKVGSMG